MYLFPVLIAWKCIFVLGMDVETKVNDRVEYCQKETFRPRCWKNEVIVMTSAIYGRMRIGKCIEAEDDVAAMGNDPRYLGCSVDVLATMDDKCSGKVQCDVAVFDDDLHSKNPCYKGLTLYLEASYSCLNVLSEERSTCHVVATVNPLHILGSVEYLNDCGRKIQPWVIEAPKGQRVNISLVQFGSPSEELGQKISTGMCDKLNQFGYVVEKQAKRNVSICLKNQERERGVYISEGNAVEIVRTDFSRIVTKPSILLRFQAIGCSDIIPPEDAWLKRDNDEAVVGCYSSRQTWQLRCDGSQWIGVLGNCSLVLSAEALEIAGQENEEQFQIVGILAICGVGLSVCFVIICIGLLYTNRFATHAQYKNDVNTKSSNTGTIPVQTWKRMNSTNRPPQTSDGRATLGCPSGVYDVYAGTVAPRCDTVVRTKNEDESVAYFVLDQNVVVKEQLLYGQQN